MKRFLKKLGFHRMDEMEQSILFKAQRNAFVFLEIALIGWSFYESYKVYAYHTRLNIIPCMLVAAALIIQNISQLIMTHNAVKGDEETPATSLLLKKIVLCIAVAAIVITIGSIIVLSVIKP